MDTGRKRRYFSLVMFTKKSFFLATQHSIQLNAISCKWLTETTPKRCFSRQRKEQSKDKELARVLLLVKFTQMSFFLATQFSIQLNAISYIYGLLRWPDWSNSLFKMSFFLSK